LISERLSRSVVCPFAGEHAPGDKTPPLEAYEDGGLRCPVCGRNYLGQVGDFLDLMPPEEASHTSLYVSQEAEFEAALDYKRISVPLLGAGVRQLAIKRMLRPHPDDRLIELGCGNGKFVYWNRRLVEWAVGIDPAPLFALDALQSVDLCRADARSLPFKDGAFTAAMSIDVLEHLPLPDIERYLREAHRVLEPDGRLFLFSNTREGSRLDFIVRSARRLARWLGERGVIDDRRDRLRKSDHVKAIATYPELVEVLKGCGFKVEQVIFWNGLFQSIIENLVMKLAETVLLRAGRLRRSGRESAGGAGGQEVVRSEVKRSLARRGVAYQGLRLLTALMWLDLALFGKWRAGPYFVLARREERD
jgi:ubiquinone/menaquinone biosynthesis C-methylase UbiE